MGPELSSKLAYRPEGFWSIPSTRRAHVTAGGLVIADHKSTPRDEVGGFLPWRVLSPMQQGYIVLDDEGRRLHRGRRMLMPTCPTARERGLAKRAQARAVRRGLVDGSLDVTVCFPSMKWKRWIAYPGVGVLVAIPMAMAWPMLSRAFSGPQSGGSLAWITLGGVVLTLLLFGGTYAAVIHRLTDSSVRRVRFRGDGLEATLERGERAQQRWADLRAVVEATGSWRLEFVDGTRLRVLSRGRSAIIMREVRRMHDPGADESVRRGHMRTAIRMFIWCQLGGLAAAWLSARLGVGRSPLAGYLVLGLGMPAMLLLVFWAGRIQSGEPFPWPWRRRSRGLERA